MIIPVRCMTCNNMLATKWLTYQDLIHKSGKNPPNIISSNREKLTEETGITVNLDGYDSNETMLAKIKAGGHGYDLAVPSDYAVMMMKEEGLQ